MPPREPSSGDREPDSGVPPAAPSGAGRRQLRTLPSPDWLDAVPGGILLLDRDLRVLVANRTAAVIVGTPNDAIVGSSFEDLLTVPARILFQTHVFPALASDGHIVEAFLTLRSDTEAPTPILLNADALDANQPTPAALRPGSDRREPRPGTPAYALLMVRIQARSRWEHELLEATRALEDERSASRRLAADLAAAGRDLEARHAEERRNREFRDAFIGVVSHELRTPITIIYGMSNLLRRGYAAMDPATMAARLEDIESESDRLRTLTEDLLVLSRAEAGRLTVAAEPLLLGHVVRSVVEAESRRLASHVLDVQIEPNIPLVLAEETYVGQVVRNFLSNAVKYSPAGTRVTTTVTSEQSGVAVRVRDEGPGLGTESPDQLFHLFFRTADAVQMTSGAGIGLFVSRELVNAMGGRIWARPGPSVGAEFGFWLPRIDETMEP